MEHVVKQLLGTMKMRHALRGAVRVEMHDSGGLTHVLHLSLKNEKVRSDLENLLAEFEQRLLKEVIDGCQERLEHNKGTQIPESLSSDEVEEQS